MIDLSKLLTDNTDSRKDLRYSKKSSNTSTGARRDTGPVVVWNITKSCNLSCFHCYAEAKNKTGPEELNTEQAKEFINDLANFNVPVLIFSGGEPLMRKDLEELIAYARNKGLLVTISTNGTLLEYDRVKKLKELGVNYIGVSLDGMEKTNDSFRGRKGAFKEALTGIRNCIELGQKVGLRFTINKHNYSEIPQIFTLMEREDIARICFYHLVPQPPLDNINEYVLPAPKKRTIINNLLAETEKFLSDNPNKEVLTVANHTDGVHLFLTLKRNNDSRADKVYEYLKRNGGNRSGIAISSVDWNGDIHPDQFTMNHTLGNIKEQKFSHIWGKSEHPLLKKLRNRKELLKGRCGECHWLDLCNGNVRSRAETLNNDFWEEDPGCYLTDSEIKV